MIERGGSTDSRSPSHNFSGTLPDADFLPPDPLAGEFLDPAPARGRPRRWTRGTELRWRERPVTAKTFGASLPTSSGLPSTKDNNNNNDYSVSLSLGDSNMKNVRASSVVTGDPEVFGVHSTKAWSAEKWLRSIYAAVDAKHSIFPLTVYLRPSRPSNLAKRTQSRHRKRLQTWGNP